MTVRGDGGAVLVAEKKHMSGPIRVNALDGERRERQAYSGHPMRVPGGVPKAMEGEHVAAGWPPWLAAVAGEAIRGWVPRRADSFEKLDKVSSFLSALLFFGGTPSLPLTSKNITAIFFI